MVDWASDRVRYVALGQERIHTRRRSLDPFWETLREVVPAISAEQPSMILPSVAQEILDPERIATLESSPVGSNIIALQAMRGTDAERIRQELSSYAARIVRDKIRHAPERIQDQIRRAIARSG